MRTSAFPVRRRVNGFEPGATAASLYTTSGRTPIHPGVRERVDPDFAEETVLWQRGLRFVAGIDEVGRGCLAGPVVAGAVILPRGWIPEGLRDSKLLDPPARERLAGEIRSGAIAWAVAAVSAESIDRLNILWATVLASMLAASRLSVRPDALLLDGGLPLPAISVPQRTVIDADRLCASVAAASVVAKVARDRFMVTMDERYPGYGFASHKGYTCREHREAILELGASPLHRRSFGILGNVPPVDQLDLWDEEG
jgi:ribonuclease HII